MYQKEELIRFRHTDFAGIVFYPRYFEMLNDLVEDWFAQALDRPFSAIHLTNGVPTVSLEVQFKQPATIGECIIKKLWVNDIGGASVKLGFLFENTKGEIILEGNSTLVNVKLQKEGGKIQSAIFDQDIKDKMSAFLNKS